MVSTRCYSDNELVEQLEAAGSGVLPPELAEHLHGCPRCRRIVSELSRLEEVEGVPPHRPSGELLSGAQVGRFTVVSRLGSGAMGVVYEAEDPALRRRVALKLLTTSGSGEEEDMRRERLLREARAMARLAHPNVVTVHEAGLWGEEVFVTMERVAGQTLHDWLYAETRPWREVLRRFIEAGEGLKAAHAAGIIHRDFKPKNVLLGEDGRVRITDFGLASPPHGGEGAPVQIGPLDATQTAPLTRGVLGTPLYMAPEQLSGERADERSDQFSFCVSLYETLFARRPFDPPSMEVEDLHAAIRQGPRFPSTPRVPERVRRLLARGLSVDPQQRHPSMGALVDALRSALGPGRAWRWTLAAMPLLGAGAVLLALLLPRAPKLQCNPALETIWPLELQQRVRAALAGQKGSTEEIVQSSAAALDAYARGWLSTYRGACEATYERHERSEQVFALQSDCLEVRRAALHAAAEAIGAKPTELSFKVVRLTESLPHLDECADVARLLKLPQLADARAKAEAKRLEREDARVLILEQSGSRDEAMALARQNVEDARALKHAPDEAHALYRLAFLLRTGPESVELFEQAVAAAIESGDDTLIAKTMVYLAEGVLRQQGRADDASRILRLARVYAAKVRSVPTLTGQLELAAGLIHSYRGNFEEALAAYERALDAHERSVGKRHRLYLSALTNAGATARHLGRWDQAKRYLEQSLELSQALFGTDHPEMTYAMTNLANLLAELGEYTRSESLHQKILEIRTARLGRSDPLTVDGLLNVGELAMDRGALELAKAPLEEALGLSLSASGPEHERSLHARFQWAALHAREKLPAAGDELVRVLADYERILGKSHGLTGYVVLEYGEWLQRQGEAGRAIQLLERAVAIFESANGKQHPLTARALGELGEARGSAQGVAELERAVSILRQSPAQPLWRGRAELALARALKRQGNDARAKAVAEQAEQTLRAVDPAWGAKAHGEALAFVQSGR